MKGFIKGTSMAMEVHGAFRCDMECFIRECAYLFHDRRLKIHFFCLFAFNSLSNVLVLVFNMFKPLL
jgi:hypothetical protein